MPRIDTDEDTDLDDAPANGAPEHEETEVEADVDAQNQVQNELADDVAEHDGPEAGEDERSRMSAADQPADDGEEEYEVEAIRAHEFRGKGKNRQLLYLIKWRGFPESDNTWEPEENLEDARDILAKYHHKNGGAPQPDVTPRVKPKSSKRNLKQSSEDLADESSGPSSKRPKKDPDTLSEWLPKGQSWENDVAQIDTVERDQATGKLYVYLKFKNGKRTKITNEKIHKHCPLALLRFYESHLNFNAT